METKCAKQNRSIVEKNWGEMLLRKKMETKCCKTKAKCYKKWKQNVCEIKILKTQLNGKNENVREYKCNRLIRQTCILQVKAQRTCRLHFVILYNVHETKVLKMSKVL